MSERVRGRLPLWTKLGLAGRVWTTFLLVRVELRRSPLPEVVERLSRRTGHPRRRYHPARLSSAVSRSLRLGRHDPTCLVSSLVLYRLLRKQGDPAELVIGLPSQASSHIAHAWVELQGRDIGPMPGQTAYVALARYPR
jgi:hypothetical protein